MITRQFEPLDEDGGEEATVAIDRSRVSSQPYASLGPLRPLTAGAILDYAWYLAMDGAQSGPYGTDELGARIGAGEVKPTASVWREGFADWTAIRSVPELGGFIPSRNPPPEPNLPSKLEPRTPSVNPLSRDSSPLGRWGSATRIIAPWQWMVLAAVGGFAASFVGLKVFGSRAQDISQQAALPVRTAAPSTAPLRQDHTSSTASRKLESLPAAAPSESAPHAPSVEVTSEGSLDSEQARAAVGTRLESARDVCWQQARPTRKAPSHGAVTATVKLVVDATGYPFRVKSLADPEGYPGLAVCIATRTLGWRFPKSSTLNTVTLTVSFRQ